MDWLPYRATLDEYDQRARALLDALIAREQEALWRVKWEHPRFRNQGIADVAAAPLALTDARLVVAREYAFEDWKHVADFTSAVASEGDVSRFEQAADAVVTGDLRRLRELLSGHPELVRARSARRHHATLLHYVAANGVENVRQKTPVKVVAIAKLLLDAGADVNAPADMYDTQCTTMSMLVSSSHPAEAGKQLELADTLIDYGAALDEPGASFPPLITALRFGFGEAAELLARRGAPHDTLPAAAGLGRVQDVARLFPAAESVARRAALALAAQQGHADVLRVLLDAGEDPNQYNPEGYHAHATPLHQAVASNRLKVVQLLVERGARLDMKDTIYEGTPLGWANHLQRAAIAEYLRARGATE